MTHRYATASSCYPPPYCKIQIRPRKGFQFPVHEWLKCKKKKKRFTKYLQSTHCFSHDHFCSVDFYTTFFPQLCDQSVGVTQTHRGFPNGRLWSYLQRVPSSYTINTKDTHQHNKASGWCSVTEPLEFKESHIVETQPPCYRAKTTIKDFFKGVKETVYKQFTFEWEIFRKKSSIIYKWTLCFIEMESNAYVKEYSDKWHGEYPHIIHFILFSFSSLIAYLRFIINDSLSPH